MPDSSLRVKLYSFLLSSSRFCPPLKNDGRGELLCHDILMLNEYIKKRIGNISCPRLSGKVAAKPSKGASVSRNEKTVFYKTVVNTCLSFLNEVKNLAKDTGIKYVFAITLCRILR